MKRILLLFALAVIIPVSAFARGGKLSTLTVFFPNGTPTESMKEVSNYLTKDLTLIEGSFINQFITQSFSGSTGKLIELIELLHTNQFELKVAFADLKDDRVTFSLCQNAAGPGKAMITVNTTKEDFKMSELKIQIPPAKGNVEPDAQAKKRGTKNPE